jgi:hypothetical protein
LIGRLKHEKELSFCVVVTWKRGGWKASTRLDYGLFGVEKCI